MGARQSIEEKRPRGRDWKSLVGARLDRLKSLGYQPEDARDLRFDFLRGFAVFAMVVDHLAGPSRLYLLTGGNRFFTSAAEGFVFISGVIVGLVYRKIAERDGLGTALRRLLARAWSLYVLAVGLTLVMLPVSEMLSLPWAQGIDLRDPKGVVWSILTLHQTYYLVDIPLLYALLLVLSPLAFFLLYDGRGWLVLLGTWAIWVGYQVYPERTEFPWTISGNYLFYFPAWQTLFFTGMAMGFHRDRIQRVVPGAWQWWLLLASALGFAALLAAYTRVAALLTALDATRTAAPQAGQSIAADMVDLLIAKGDVRPGRIFASVVVFGFFFLLATRFWRPLYRALGWFLVPLGRNSLYAYSAHVAVALGIGMFTVLTGRALSGTSEVNAGIQVASLGVIWLAIRYRIAYPTPQTRGRWMASVIPLALAVVVILPLDPSPDLPGMAAVATPTPATSARAVRRFGTPLPRAAATSASPPLTGTPSPVQEGAAPPRSAQTPVPLPAPVARGPAGDVRVSEFVGTIQGRLREVQFFSPAVDDDESYFVYLPPGYGTEGRRYPVLYMLHGGGGDKEEWLAYGLVDAVDRLIVSKELRPLIVVLPQGDTGYWVDPAGDGPRWGDYTARDLVRQVDATFRTLPDPVHRAIGGLSMGGYGALYQALAHPDVFHAAGAHSPSLQADNSSVPFLGTGQDFVERDPVQLALAAPGIEHLAIWIDIGEDDPWLPRAEELHQALVLRGIPHNYNVLAGYHEGTYWETNLLSYLRFYDAVLH